MVGEEGESCPEIDAPPNVSAWTDEMLRGWAPPACTRWTAPTPAVVVALAGSFRHADGADAVLGRFGAVSRLRGIRYWSVSDKDWRTLITDAFAVNELPASTTPVECAESDQSRDHQEK